MVFDMLTPSLNWPGTSLPVTTVAGKVLGRLSEG
jgi:hypothetical protein